MNHQIDNLRESGLGAKHQGNMSDNDNHSLRSMGNMQIIPQSSKRTENMMYLWPDLVSTLVSSRSDLLTLFSSVPGFLPFSRCFMGLLTCMVRAYPLIFTFGDFELFVTLPLWGFR